MQYGLRESNINLIKEKLSSNPKVTEVILFGSRAKGNYKPGSDIDLAIKGDVNLKDILSLLGKLDELNLPYKFDLIIFNHIQETELLEHIKRVGKILFKKNLSEYA
jgi:predicted nucleotidyltransferase